MLARSVLKQNIHKCISVYMIYISHLDASTNKKIVNIFDILLHVCVRFY